MLGIATGTLLEGFANKTIAESAALQLRSFQAPHPICVASPVRLYTRSNRRPQGTEEPHLLAESKTYSTPKLLCNTYTQETAPRDSKPLSRKNPKATPDRPSWHRRATPDALKDRSRLELWRLLNSSLIPQSILCRRPPGATSTSSTRSDGCWPTRSWRTPGTSASCCCPSRASRSTTSAPSTTTSRARRPASSTHSTTRAPTVGALPAEAKLAPTCGACLRL